jgi:hypothetical protein
MTVAVVTQDVKPGAKRRPDVVPGNRVQKAVVEKHNPDGSGDVALLIIEPHS